MASRTYQKMDPVAKSSWIEALRSGDYKQSFNLLCRLAEDGPKYCCLGVLAEIMSIPYEKMESPTTDACKHYKFPDGPANRFYIPNDFCGVDNNAIKDLSDMNDGKLPKYINTSASFKEIADWIEKNL